jgi:protein arginine kinase activator
MLCQHCGKNEASIQLTKIVKGKKTVVKICMECAKKAGYENSLSAGTFPVSSFLGSIMPEGSAAETGDLPKLKCSGCGLTYGEFRKSGQLGCSLCYRTFFDHLKDLLRRIHGSNDHVGKVPRSSRDKFIARRKLNKLQHQMKKAVKSEDFEQAAALRDKIQRLQNLEKKISGEEVGE